MLERSVEMARLVRGRIPMEERKEDLAVLMVDVSDSTRLYESLGDEVAFREVRACLDLFEKAIAVNGGRVAKTVGDGLICVFKESAGAVAAACEMQARLRDNMAQRARPIAVRIGLHYGPVLSNGDDIFGDAVKIAERMTRFAAGGQIITTGDTVAHLPPGLLGVTRRLDEFSFAGRAEKLAVHEVLWQQGGEFTQLPGEFDVMLAQAGIARLRVVHAGRDLVVVMSLTMGRHAGNDIVLKDRMASRNHARIERRKDKFVLIDLSANGTFVAMDGGDLIKLRREELLMYGSGRITFGHAATDVDAEAVSFTIE